jgi:prephenate dehydrogenase
MNGSTEGTSKTPIIAIFGLDPLGRAIGLALQAVKTHFEIVGHDPEGDRMKVAKETGSVDRVTWDVGLAAAEADVLILTEPTATTLATLGHVAPVVKQGAVVTDTGPLKAPVMARAAAVLPAGASFVGGHLIARLDPADPAAALAGATWCLMPAPTASDDAVYMMRRLVTAVGATPYFIDPDEHDALTMGIGPMGYLMSAVVLRMIAASPSLRDLRRLAPAEFAAFDESSDEEASLRAIVGSSGESLRPWLDALAAEVNRLRAAAHAGDTAAWEIWFEEVAGARNAWAAAAAREADERNAAFEELSSTSLVKDALFGRRAKR